MIIVSVQACKISRNVKNDLTDDEAMEYLKKTEELIEEIDGIVIPDVDALLDS